MSWRFAWPKLLWGTYVCRVASGKHTKNDGKIHHFIAGKINFWMVHRFPTMTKNVKRLQVGEGFSLPSMWGTNLEMVETLCAQKEMVGYLEQLQLGEKMWWENVEWFRLWNLWSLMLLQCCQTWFPWFWKFQHPIQRRLGKSQHSEHGQHSSQLGLVDSFTKLWQPLNGN